MPGAGDHRGQPDTKDSILSRELANGNIQQPALFLGDSRYDHQAATQAGLEFVFVSGWSEVKDWQAWCAKQAISVVPQRSALRLESMLMPIICRFFGIIVRMFFNEHAPPHFHAEYGAYRVVIDIRQLEVIEGKFPRRALNLVLDWAELHQTELLQNWERCQAHQQPIELPPLE